MGFFNKMEISSCRKRLLLTIFSVGVVITGFSDFTQIKENKNSELIPYFNESGLFVEGNSIVAPNNPSPYSPSSARKMRVILTAYSSSFDETWGDPFITASGERTRDGIVANNCLPFGTIVEIDGMYFEVLDRKNSRYGCEWFDIWQPSKEAALKFGIKRDYAKIY